MTTDNVLVRVNGVSKRFCRDLKRSLRYGVQDVVSELMGRDRSQADLRRGEFLANDGVSFELKRSSCLGLIGRNGAGKTTLLKMLNGLIKPDRGTIEMKGRVGALIALGAGFNPILTGRENIYVNGSVLGLSKREITRRLDEIIDFAEISQFIDSPVQSYSSGMQVRLGFAVATALDPDILILDEVLAVGDAAFRAKCYRRISEMRKRAAVIFVSHNMNQVGRICDSVLTLSKGKVVFSGPTREGIEVYEKLNSDTDRPTDAVHIVNDPLRRFDVSVSRNEFVSGGEFSFRIEWEASAPLSKFCVRLMIMNGLGQGVADATYEPEVYGVEMSYGSGVWSFDLPSLPLKNGKYDIGVTLVSADGEILAWSFKEICFQVVGASVLASADCHLPTGAWRIGAVAAAMP